ncbi:MAG TPA: ankyrin repeat domain-containing protein, partial [Pirellulales bacterium]|nr:ankyrin repeat domain-containing protein [Pirellulales bacterium]
MIYRRIPRKPALKAAVLLALCIASIAVGQEAKHEAFPLPWSDAKMIALAGAIEVDDPARIDQCIADGADVNFAGENQVTPLAWSIVEQKERAFRRLLELGADPNCVDNAGRSPLILAAECNEFDLVELLLKAGADYRHKDAKGRDLLYEFIATSPDANNHDTDLKQKAAVWLAAQSRERVHEWLLDKGVSFDEAESRFARGNWDKDQLRNWWGEEHRWALRCSSSEPKDARAFRLRAAAQMVKLDWQKAIADCTEAIHLEANAAAGYMLRGRAWHETGIASDAPDEAYQSAIADFTEAIRLDPRRGDAFAERAPVWESKREYLKAIADLSDAILREPSNPTFYWRRAEARIRRASSVSAPDEWEKAVDDCNRAIELDPENPRVYHARGLARARLSKLDEAIADQTRAIELAPDYAQAYLHRAFAWSFKARRIPRSWVEPRSAEGDACFDKAIEDATEAIRIDPKNALAYSRRAIYWEEKRHFDHAIADYSEAIRLEPRTDFYRMRADAWRTKHEHDKAVADYSEAIRLNNTGTWYLAQAYNGRGEVWLAEMQYQKAVDDFTEAIRLNDYFAARENRRAAWRAMREFQKILDDLKAFSQEEPERPDAWREL